MARTNGELTPNQEKKQSIRNAILGAQKIKTTQIEFFGQTVELRQPTMDFILNMNSEENRARAAAQMIIGYTYVPGTEERVFEDADLESIMALPFGQDVNRLNRAISSLTTLDIPAAEGNSETTEPDTSP
jgi:hypothetical protein